MWNKNERNGKVDQAKGKVKQAVGKLTRNDDLKAEGHVDETVGKVETAVGRISRKTGDAITRVGKAVKRWQPHATIADPVILDPQRYALQHVLVATVNTGEEPLAT